MNTPIKSVSVLVVIMALVARPAIGGSKEEQQQGQQQPAVQGGGKPNERVDVKVIGNPRVLEVVGLPPLDCKDAFGTYQRLNVGLRVQEEAMERTQVLIETAVREMVRANKDAERKLFEDILNTLKSLGKDVATSSAVLRLRVAALKVEGVSAEDRRTWLQTMKKIQKRGEYLEKLPGSAKAGYRFGMDIQNGMHELADYLAQANRLFVESGIAKQLGGELSKGLGGPLGRLAFNSLIVAIDQVAIEVQNSISSGEYVQAQQNLINMRHQYNRITGIRDSLRGEIATACPGMLGSNVVEVETEQSAEPADEKGGSRSAAPILLLGGLGVVAAGAGYYAYQRAGKSSCGSKPFVSGFCRSGAQFSSLCDPSELQRARAYCECRGEPFDINAYFKAPLGPNASCQ